MESTGLFHTDATFHVAPGTQKNQHKSRRVLACVLCQKRKVKCDRRFPCSNCIRASTQCIPATLTPPRRKRKVAERELLDRLRHCEDLLRDNGIDFEPLREDAQQQELPPQTNAGIQSPSNAQSSAPASQRNSEEPESSDPPLFKAKSFWHVMNQTDDHGRNAVDPERQLDENDDNSTTLTELVDINEVKEIWNQLHENQDQLFFGTANTNIELSTLHPAQAQIFKLWQTYLENVDPLLKVTHTPSLQARITDAAADVHELDPSLQALMFSIYCVSLASIMEDGNPLFFNVKKQELMQGYSLGCREALLRIDFMRTNDRDCLTALFLYLVSRRRDTAPASLCSMFGLAMRIAQRMGIQNESTNANYAPFEAEMRRRLWWSMVIFDNRVCEMSDQKSTLLTPTWDCSIPLNINDSEIRPDMKTLPSANQQLSDSIIVVVRSELSDLVRYTSAQLDFVNPALKKLTSHRPTSLESQKLDELMENKYLKFCNPENPLHFFALWITRGFIAKTIWLEKCLKVSSSSAQIAESDRDTALSFALKWLECDTKLRASPLVERFRWQVYFLFPFPAYVFIAQELRRRPVGAHADVSWRVMGDSYSAHFKDRHQSTNPGFRVFSTALIRAWDNCEEALRQRNMQHQPPEMIVDIRQKLALTAKTSGTNEPFRTENLDNGNFGNQLLTPAMNFMGYNPQFAMGHSALLNSTLNWPPMNFGQPVMGSNPYLLDWSVMDWNFSVGDTSQTSDQGSQFENHS